ncbi:NAD(P)-dependent alcohol dehydrogenase [Curtobacterium sp. 18060]|uniref:NAD(P)-dependent alcohol dehydrogenase n=1 Tax=Curtobacterium sp. 18060 TaxID=2681408 RepID=UPI001359A60D|nr:NAD(P)-dependent alcohol dehydrogenase [Curtobacterium sp. 18060]
MSLTMGWQSQDPNSNTMTRVQIERRELNADDVAVRIDYCGVCHSDLHRIHGMLGEKDLVPGHEFTGVITATGTSVTKFAVGDAVAVGTIINSCGQCAMCQIGQENFCLTGATTTYGGKGNLKGGYSREYVLTEKFAFPIPEGLDPVAAGPLMCAGISVWEPMRAAGVGPSTRMAVAGLGGLGHLAVKLGVALGAEVTVLSRTADKTHDALALGAKSLLVTTDETAMAQSAGRFDYIIDTIAADHELSPLLRLLWVDGSLCVLGNPLMTGPRLLELGYGRKKLTSSGTGGLPQTAELLQFCADNNIAPTVEVLPSAQVKAALDRLAAGDVRYRFVLDMSDLDDPTTPA